MWLLDVGSYQLDYYPQPTQAPPYATLSHSWSNQEITLGHLRVSQNVPYNARVLLQRASSRKILKACAEAQARNYQKLWLDSLCVDWSSSSELSEDINSMFLIYQCSQVCFAYLDGSDADEKSFDNPGRYIEHSKWRNRVWMLQELIAPPKVLFYTQSWKEIGTRDSLIYTLSNMLSIDEAVLRDSENLSGFTIGRRMSWASKLEAHKPEDTAYSLLGILNVQMPISYGEQSAAFLRLQEQILKDTKDATVLLWRPKDHQQYRGLLAHSPSEYSHFGRGEDYGPLHVQGNIQLSSMGLIVEDLFQLHQPRSELILCLTRQDEHGAKAVLGIPLKKWQNTYLRSSQYLLYNLGDVSSGSFGRICVSRDVDGRTSNIISRQFPPSSSANMQDSQNHRIFSDGLAVKPDLRKPNVGNNMCDATRHKSRPKCLDDGIPVAFATKRTETIQGDYKWTPESTHIQISDHSLGQKTSQTSFPSNQDPSRESQVGPPSRDLMARRTNSKPNPLNINQNPLSEKDMRLLIDCGLQDFSQWHAIYGKNHFQRALRSSLTKRRKISQRENATGNNCTADKDVAAISDNPVTNFACPFQLQDPCRYWSCLKHGDFSSIYRLKQHILSEHRKSYHCPICRKTFTLASVRNEHINERLCNPDTFPEVEGLTTIQIKQLSRRCDPSQTKNEQWRSIWGHLFPNTDPPTIIYPPVPINHLVRSMERFWLRRGEAILLKVMGLEDFEGNIINITKHTLAVLNQKVLDHMTERLLWSHMQNGGFCDNQMGNYSMK